MCATQENIFPFPFVFLFIIIVEKKGNLYICIYACMGRYGKLDVNVVCDFYGFRERWCVRAYGNGFALIVSWLRSVCGKRVDCERLQLFAVGGIFLDSEFITNMCSTKDYYYQRDITK